MAVHGGEAVSVALLFSLAFFCARLLLDRLVYKPLAVYLFNTKASKLMNNEARQAKIVKFSESIWKLTYYASVQAWVLMIIKQEPWSLDMMQYFDGWPNQPIV
ncbi:LAG1 longevity assurance homolog 2 [Zea mays]|nr:LAG1 longevity assurance homolog 2 [Zea mays]